MNNPNEDFWNDLWKQTRGTQVEDEIEGLDEDPTGDIVDFDSMEDDLAV